MDFKYEHECYACKQEIESEYRYYKDEDDLPECSECYEKNREDYFKDKLKYGWK